jgi:small subunit ribosomal protein S9
MAYLSVSEKNSAYFGIGRRKTSVARVLLVPGRGVMLVNGKQYRSYDRMFIIASKRPLEIVGSQFMYDIYVNTHGGGVRGQADAIKLGVARALFHLFSENHTPEFNTCRLRSEGFLTRDSRRKERKKYGLKKARKAPQFSKR